MNFNPFRNRSWKLTNAGHLYFALLVALMSGLYLFNDFSWNSWAVNIVVICAVDLYILRLLYVSAHYADNVGEQLKWPALPDRVSTLPIAFLLIVTLVFSFGSLYIDSGAVCGPDTNGKTNEACGQKQLLEKPSDAFYFSLGTIMTLGLGDYTPARPARYLVVSELASGLLTLLLAIAVFASRLATFGRSAPIETTRLPAKITIRRRNGDFVISYNKTETKELPVSAGDFDNGVNIEGDGKGNLVKSSGTPVG